MTNISEHITYQEATRSKTAEHHSIDNTPNATQLNNMRIIANAVFEPLRKHFGIPIYITSFFRSWLLNRKIKGAKGSQHLKGEAMDMVSKNKNISNARLFYYIATFLDYDQLIWEFGNNQQPKWIHVSYTTFRRNRKLITISYKVGKKTKYKHFPNLEQFENFKQSHYGIQQTNTDSI